MLYLGGGIGHLEQFSSENNGDKDLAMQSNNYAEIEKDLPITETGQDEEDGGNDEDSEGDGKEMATAMTKRVKRVKVMATSKRMGVIETRTKSKI